MKAIETIAELVGGCADGVQLSPEFADQPDDWPDVLIMKASETACDRYDRRVDAEGIQIGPIERDGKRIYYFDVVP